MSHPQTQQESHYLETSPFAEASFCSLTGPGLWGGTLPFFRMFLMFVRFPPNRTHPLAGGRGARKCRLPPGSTPAERRWKHRCVSRATGAVGLVGRPDGALDSVLGQDVGGFPIGEQKPGDLPRVLSLLVHLARLGTSTATIAFIAERSSAGQGAGDCLVAVGITGSGRVGTIALRECDRRAAGAVRRSCAAAFGRKHERRTTWRDRDPDARFSEKRSCPRPGAGRGGDLDAGGAAPARPLTRRGVSSSLQ